MKDLEEKITAAEASDTNKAGAEAVKLNMIKRAFSPGE